eukprot:TRINITY_DN65761_c11_g6_i1.p1 TRINITY_DN65761_c11_g6~~TRINITY_DN65761_c11_g6_i1.p1  ORF type:complete len:177 (+),score=65.00 TRINITY_DN65761_c11_g6_i1:44-574(+)
MITRVALLLCVVLAVTARAVDVTNEAPLLPDNTPALLEQKVGAVTFQDFRNVLKSAATAKGASGLKAVKKYESLADAKTANAQTNILYVVQNKSGVKLKVYFGQTCKKLSERYSSWARATTGLKKVISSFDDGESGKTDAGKIRVDVYEIQGMSICPIDEAAKAAAKTTFSSIEVN